MTDTPKQKAIAHDLAHLAERRKKAEELVEDLRNLTHELLVEGYDEGLSKGRLAREAGLTRQTVYTALFKAGRS